MINEIVIRVAENEDAESIQQINLLTLGYDYDIDSPAIQLTTILNNENSKIFVAEIENRVVGYIHGSDYNCTYASSMKDIIGLAVLAEYRRYGIGRKLLEKLEEWAKNDGSEGIRLVSGFDRLNAHEFYIRCGYEERKKQKNFFKLFER